MRETTANRTNIAGSLLLSLTALFVLDIRTALVLVSAVWLDWVSIALAVVGGLSFNGISRSRSRLRTGTGKRTDAVTAAPLAAPVAVAVLVVPDPDMNILSTKRLSMLSIVRGDMEPLDGGIWTSEGSVSALGDEFNDPTPPTPPTFSSDRDDVILDLVEASEFFGIRMLILFLD